MWIQLKKTVKRINGMIWIDENYFNSAFIKPMEENVSGLTLRLMAFLILELSFYQYQKLPSRKLLSQKLGANTSSINKSLAFLEDHDFFKRCINPEFEGMVRVTPEKQKEADLFYEQQRKLNREKKKFNDYFILNPNFNQSQDITSVNASNFFDMLQVQGNDPATTIENFLINLLQNPDVVRRLAEEVNNV